MKKGASRGLFVLASVTLIVAGVSMSHAGKGNAMAYAAQPRNKSARPAARPKGDTYPKKMTLYYVPFYIETMVPITEANLKNSPNARIEITSKTTMFVLRGYLSRRGCTCRHSFSRNDIRVLLVPSDGSETIAVDNEGVVRRGSRVYALSGKTMVWIHNFATNDLRQDTDYGHFLRTGEDPAPSAGK